MITQNDITISNVYVTENSADSSVVAILGVENAGGGTPVFTLLDDAGGRFELFNNAGVWEVRVADGSLLDAEQDLQHRISVLVDDGAGGTRSEAFSLAVRDVADPLRGLGNDVLINTTTSGFQTLPSVTGLENGNFVAAWTDFSGTDGSASGIRGRLFAADGSPLNNDFIINTTTTGDQLEPDITSLESGGFVVTWRDDNATDGSGSSIRGRIYDANGTPEDDDFIINTTTTGDQLEPSVTDLADGGFIVTWRDSSGTDGSGSGIRGRIFADDGTPEDDDFIINTTTANAQLQSSVTGLGDGNFVVTWTDFSGTDGAGAGIRGRLFAADGTPIDDDFVINTSTAGFQLVPSVTSLSNGGFVVTWRDENGTDGSDFGIQGRIFAADGTPAGNDFVVNTTTNGNQFVASVTGLASGGFVVTWSDDGGADGSGSGIRGRAFAADGTPVGNDFFVNTTTADDQYQPSVAGLADGGFVVTWRDDSGADGSISAIQGRVFAEDGSLAVFGVEGGNIARDSAAGTVVASLTGAGFSFSLTDDADGRFELAGNQIVVAAGANLDADSATQYVIEVETTDGLGNPRIERLPVFVEDPSGPAFGVSPEFLVNTTTLNSQINPSAAGLADGGFVVTWSDDSGTDGSGLGIRGRVFAADGTPAGDDFIVNTTTADTQIDPSVTGLANGSFVAMWSDAGGADGANSGIIGRIFAADGTPAGDDFVVNSTTASFQSEASVTGLLNGGFVATWRDDGGADGSGSGIQGRIFAADGTPAGNDFVVNTTTAGNQLDPSATSLVNGSFVVTWRDNNGADGSDSGVFGRVFAADGTPLGDDFIVNTTTASFQIEPSVTGLADGGFVVTWRDNSGADGSSSGIQGRLFAEDGTPAGDDFIVNSTTDSFQIEPSVTGLADGGFVVTWRDGSGTDGSGSGIRGRAFTPDGRPVGDDFIVNTTTASNQEEPSVTALANGGFVVAWRDVAGDGSGTGIRAQVFAVGAEVTANAQVLGTSGNDVQLEGSQFKDDIFGLAGNDIASGKAGDDRLFGAEGDDRLRGDEGSDLLSGGSGSDLLEGDSENARDYYDAQTFRMYQAALDRTPDGPGLEDWSSRLLDGTETILTVANGFVTSTEFVTTYGSLDDTQFVNLLYNNVLDREADAGGLAAWLNALATGSTRAEVVVGFSESKELIGNTQEATAAFLSSGLPIVLTDDVYRLYQATLDRDPDAAGLLNWLTALGGGATKQQVADGFVSSTEFQSVYGALDDAQFVTLLYNNVLDRDPDAGGFANWLDEINAGAERAEVVLGFSDSAEFIENSQAGANAWLQSVDLGNDVLFGGAGDDRMFGGLGADTFVFDASLDGADFVGDLESWDTLVFNGFSYTTKEDVLAHVTQVGPDAVFSDQGNTITFYNTDVADLDNADMFNFDDTSLLS